MFFNKDNCIFMFNTLIAFLYLFSLIKIFVSGNISAANALMSGAEDAVMFCVSITGSMCLWCALTEVFEQCGAASALSRMLKPFISLLMPISSRDEEISAAVSENISANIMGLGNAATPAGIRAAQKIAALGSEKSISDELCMLVVLNTASLQLIPSSAAALRTAAGALSPFDIVPAVWFSTLCALSAGLLSAFILKRLWR